METIEATKIIIGDEVLWTAPFGKDKATITAVKEDLKMALVRLHQKFPEVFELMVDEADFCREDMAGAFSVIVDPEIVGISVDLGKGCLCFTLSNPCDEDCDNCPHDCGTEKKEESADE